MTKEKCLLQVKDLKVHFAVPEGLVRAVDGITFDVPAGKTLALVGESGCGKTVTSLSLLRLLKVPPAIISAEVIDFNGIDLGSLNKEEIRKIRGKEIAMIFQEPMTSLNPVFRISRQMREVYKTHSSLAKAEIDSACIDMLEKVGIPDAKNKFKAFPHELSGGLRQRIMIAMALASKPKLLIADEPTTALDVTIQAQILLLLKSLSVENKMSILLITHDFGVVADIADQVAVMYAGKIVESGPLEAVLYSPLHPYTEALIRSIPGLKTRRGERLKTIKGMVPNPLLLQPGCRFAPRCEHADEHCYQQEPLTELIDNRTIACFKWRRS